MFAEQINEWFTSMQHITMITNCSLRAEARFYSYLGPGTQRILGVHWLKKYWLQIQRSRFLCRYQVERVVQHLSILLTVSSPPLESFKESTDGTCQEQSRSSSTNRLDDLSHPFPPSCSVVQLERTRKRKRGLRNTETVTSSSTPAERRISGQTGKGGAC